MKLTFCSLYVLSVSSEARGCEADFIWFCWSRLGCPWAAPGEGISREPPSFLRASWGPDSVGGLCVSHLAASSHLPWAGGSAVFPTSEMLGPRSQLVPKCVGSRGPQTPSRTTLLKTEQRWVLEVRFPPAPSRPATRVFGVLGSLCPLALGCTVQGEALPAVKRGDASACGGWGAQGAGASPRPLFRPFLGPEGGAPGHQAPFCWWPQPCPQHLIVLCAPLHICWTLPGALRP